MEDNKKQEMLRWRKFVKSEKSHFWHLPDVGQSCVLRLIGHHGLVSAILGCAMATQTCERTLCNSSFKG
ncbi:hypothetical protein L484_010240 [Morus notabilis]|uniref:Uncharacterized protein n=1 Tax=Morus notabilis TaxID=981085 RepID=W9RST8_9ROSA|nr:hypothetical protein L484_010240 [Morus notabilis]